MSARRRLNLPATPPPIAEGVPEHTAKWFRHFGVNSSTDIGRSPVLHAMLAADAEFRHASGVFLDRGTLIVTGPTAQWSWAEPGGPCLRVQSVFPILRPLAQGAHEIVILPDGKPERTFKIGDRVILSVRTRPAALRGTTGRVTAINEKSCGVVFDQDRGRYGGPHRATRCPKSLLEHLA